MPTPALDRLRQTADKLLKVAGPPARTVRDRVTREVGERLGGRLGRRVQDVAPQRAAEEPSRAQSGATSTKPSTKKSGPNPASIAKNVAHERPHAKQPATARRDPESVPGGKLPPRRPRPA